MTSVTERWTYHSSKYIQTLTFICVNVDEAHLNWRITLSKQVFDFVLWGNDVIKNGNRH